MKQSKVCTVALSISISEFVSKKQKFQGKDCYTMSVNKHPIAVIDSGLGGVSVLCHILKELPSEDIVYFGDNANAPYGSKTTEAVRALTVENIKMLRKKYDIKAVIIACNTATGAAAEKCREIFPDMPIIGIEPAVKPAVLRDDVTHPRVLVMATPLTLGQEKFVCLARKYNPDAELVPLPCPHLSEVIEAGAPEKETNELLNMLLSPVERENIDSVVLGCTHYPLISDKIAAFFPKARIFDGGKGTALQTKRRLAECSLLACDGEKGKLTIINSKNNEDFSRLVCSFAGISDENL